MHDGSMNSHCTAHSTCDGPHWKGTALRAMMLWLLIKGSPQIIIHGAYGGFRVNHHQLYLTLLRRSWVTSGTPLRCRKWSLTTFLREHCGPALDPQYLRTGIMDWRSNSQRQPTWEYRIPSCQEYAGIFFQSTYLVSRSDVYARYSRFSHVLTSRNKKM